MQISKRIKNKSAVVCVVGVGYVGLPLAEAFSEHLKVIGYDLNSKKVEDLNTKNKHTNLTFTTNPAEI
jgi:UDP-N-acetyl-D-galactosamine dehydrogenase